MAKPCGGPAGSQPSSPRGLSTRLCHLPKASTGAPAKLGGQHRAEHRSGSAQSKGMSYHHWENNSSRGGLDDPEQGQAEQLDDGEEVHPAQGHVAEVGEVRLVLGWHQEQPHAVRELQRGDGTGSHTSSSSRGPPPCWERGWQGGFLLSLLKLSPPVICAATSVLRG